ncbi:uncharacterized protein LOC129574245 isoform X2 [Sitodiplosis mosellana]|uniref:uncharacterized protein LOC129574245 isoform X2 n=1 Tax=Sitodiplosis mosellana TaxID=263140 RepID=UPI002444DD76|nr:uncharacterized protein LOC129574245 isoform X2 [Sitodiplosis mosellana]XP_055312069.1 uncharacterized protein LOC129574245 isoform X2 [Sitodiplosis mosellana]XP_055312077.1 uncharacterized protein LOC129574245 isoform X2 [Sitodiplosis mosellana]XP_055312085.1 uncharacterized protein LOC129574245 isoform X2 [Sitodiplosis mosellana]XP_055312095.1 uncharacterized protein LOC129574245 isoform X2 [Sitodiplosis mosellana]XP_055312103.1 uncharacterized protein LOC129574245 isoform X2 [Sitodiplosi
MEEAVHKFEALQRYIPFLERFLLSIKAKADTKEDLAKKYDKADQLLTILKLGFKSKYKVPFLENIEKVLEGLCTVYTRKIISNVKLEKVEPVDSIKMENDFQSPESPPSMYQDFKSEREPITIPTERRDSNNYFYDTKPSTSRIVDRHDDYKRHNERRHREKSLSRSRSPSYERPSYERSSYDRPSYDRRVLDRKRYRYSRSRSRSRSPSRNRDRRRSRSRERRRERTRSPSYRRRSPEHQRRSKSPHYRHRRDERKFDRDRDYQSSEYGRNNSDSKKYVKMENDFDFKRESKWHGGSSIKQESHNRRDNRDEPTVASSRYPNPLSRFASSTSTSDRYVTSDSIKHESDKDSDKNLNRSKPHPTISRFGGRGMSSVEESDIFRDTIRDENIDQLERITYGMFGRTEDAEKIAKHMQDLDVIADLRKKAIDLTDQTLEKDIIGQLDFGDEFDEAEETVPIPSSTEPEPPIQLKSPNEHRNETQNAFWNENRHEPPRNEPPRNEPPRNEQFRNETTRNETRNAGWNELRSEFRSGKDSHIENRPDSRINIRDFRTVNRIENSDDNQRPPVPISSTIPAPVAGIPHPIPGPPQPIPNTAEERIALSDKYQRRKRNSNSGANTGDINQSPQPNDQNASQQPQQDPRLRNRPNACTITSGASLTEQFISYGNLPPPPHPPSFGSNFNRNHPQTPDVCPPQQQRPFFGEPFPSPHRPPHPHHLNMAPSRPGQHMHSPSNSFSPNIGFGANAMQPNPRNNPFHPNSNTHQQQQHNYHHQDNRPRETYGEHKRRMRELEEQRKRSATFVSSTTARNTANEQSKEPPNHESPTQSPNQMDNTQAKDVEKEKTSPSTANKPHNKVDNAFRSNNWEALPQSKSGNSFKIPKLNRSNSNTSTTRTSTGDSKGDSPENNVSTSTKTSKVSKPSNDSSSKDPRVVPKKTPESSKNRKTLSDSKKSNNKKRDTKLPENDAQIHADTTILTETEQTPEEPANVSESQPELIKQIPEDLLKVLQNIAGPRFDAIKNILGQDAVPNDDAVTSSTQPAQTNAKTDTSDKSKANQPRAENAKVPKKPKKHHSNELERLNADIRENIPDVLHATGRRTCTLGLQKSNDNSPTKTPKSVEKPKASGHKSDDETQSDIEKPKRIARRRNTTIDARPIVFDYDGDETPSENTEAQPLTNRITRRRNTVRESSPCVIESEEENEEEPVKSKPNKPGPKSTKKDATQTEPSTEDQALAASLPKCTVVLETVNVSKEMKRITRSSKRKAEQLNLSSEGSESTVEKEQPDVDDSSTEPKRQRIDIQNTDKTMTTKSKRCHFCDKNFQFLSSHYANMHEDHEVYSARMSAKNSEKVRRFPPKNAAYRNAKFTTHCYYCEKDVTYERSRLIAHFIRHTGEFTRNCTKCGIKLTANTDMKNDGCVHAEKLSPMVDFDDTLYVYMCNFCNYTQYQEENMKNHIRNMHQINLNVTGQYTKIVLIPNLTGSGRGRTGRRLPSTSESESVAHSEELVNQDVFKPSNQDDDVLSDAYKLIQENSFNTLDTVKPATSGTSIADRLRERFKKQQENPSAPVVKEEAVDAHEIVYRSPDEISKSVEQTEKETARPNPLVDGDVIENGCKIEVNKTEANASGIQPIDVDDADDWESCSDEDGDEEEDVSPHKSLNNSLSRLIMIKQKTNKGRMRSKKRGDKSIFSTLKKEKSDEVIDLEKEIKDEKSPEKSISDISIRPVQADQKRVDNIAYSEYLGQQKFHCFIGNCDYMSINNTKSLSNHLRQKHGTERWNGNCYACEKQIMNLGNYSLMKEFDHLMDIHVPNNNPAPKPIVHVPEPPKQPVEAEKPVEPPRTPMIRIRRLSGDILSGGIEQITPNPGLIQPQSQPPLQPTMPTISSVSSIPTTQFATSDDAVTNSDNHLKPWTNGENTKSARAELKLKRECSLVALFKCMAKDCIFTTSDKEKMLEHLSNHEDFIMQQASYGKNHSIQDHSSWLECCYCEEIEGSCSILVDHIINEHATSIFQCPYCFYRSVDRGNVSSHLKQYHSHEDEKYILVCGTETKGLTNEITDIVRVQHERVQMVRCPEAECNATFVHLLDLNQHFRKQHSDKSFYNCNICSKTLKKSPNGGDVDTKHLHEHGFSLCHCAYCSYYCTDTSSMHTHLRDEHPTKLPYSFVRIRNGSPNTQRQPSIAYFGYNDNHKDGLVCLPLTETQLNFMNPSLSESIFNSGDPPGDDDSEPSIVAVDKAQFNSARKLDEFETAQARQQYYIKPIDAITTVNRVPVNDESTFAIPSTSNENLVTTEYDAMMQREIDLSANTLLNETGVEKNDLYRCAHENCTWVRSDEREFLMHLSQHQREGANVFTCFHCHNSYPLPVDLKNHINEHLKHRFFCFYCDVTTGTQQVMDDHFATSHRNQDTHYLPLNPLKYELTTDTFVACPSDTQAINDFITRLVNRFMEQRAAKKAYMPEESESLPHRSVFPHELQCGRCGYSNKVRVNLVRHFRNGCNEQQAPVNPVPCLSSNERHFDKMKNLAASSNSSSIESGIGKYVPEEKRFVCGAKSCRYQSMSAEMLQKHIVTLHESDTCFGCPHCGEDLSHSTTATEILNHLRYHDSKIFKCPHCPFIHYLKPQVERHISENHPTSKDRAITLERPAKKVEPVKPAAKSITYKWSCNICSKIFNTRALVKAHLGDAHRLSCQFKCSICSFSHDTKAAIKEHLAAEHRENDATKIKSHFDRVESEADNTPIWRRDDPTRIEKM